MSTYLERLIRQDLGGPVRRAVASRDPGTVELLESIGAFLGSVAPADPDSRAGRATGGTDAPGVVDAIAAELLRPLLEGWAELDAAGRRATLALLRATAGRWPAVVRRLTAGTLLAPGVARLLRGDVEPDDAEAARLLARQRPLAFLSRAARYARLGVTRLRTIRPASS